MTAPRPAYFRFGAARRLALPLLLCIMPAAALLAREPGTFSPPDPDAAEAFFETEIQNALAAGTIRGATVAYATRGAERLLAFGVAESGAGITPDRTVFPFGQISSVVTTLAVLRFVREGRLDLEDPVQKFLQKPLRPETRGRELRLKHLLTGTSGLSDRRIALYTNEPETSSSHGDFFADRDTMLVADPGQVGYDSPLAIGLAGAALERAAGRPFATTMGRVLSSLEMNDARYDPAHPGDSETGSDLPRHFRSRLPAVDGLFGTTRDAARLLDAILNPGSTPLHEIRFRPTPAATGFSLGLREGRNAANRFLFRDAGPGSAAGRLLLLPQRETGWVVLVTPAPGEGPAAQHLTRRITDAFFQHFASTATPADDTPPETIPTNELARLPGTYAFAGRSRFTLEKFTTLFHTLKIKAVDARTLTIRPEIAGQVCGLRGEQYFRLAGPGLLASVPTREARTPIRFIAYDRDAGASAPRLFCDTGEAVTFERLPWTAYPGLHLRLGLLCLAAALALFFIGGRIRFGAEDLDRLRRLGRFFSLLTALYLILILPAALLPGPAYLPPLAAGVPLLTEVVLGIGLFAMGLGSTLGFLTLRKLIAGDARGQGLWYPAAALMVYVVFLALLLYWNLLGFLY